MEASSKVVDMKKPEKMMVMTVTPEIARSWLEVNIHNRPVNDNTIKRYVEAMKSGQWELNGETIKFSDEGMLLDGQHRLRAVVQSGVTIKSYAIFGLPQKVFDTIDTGRNRTIGDLLALDGEHNGSVMGPVLRLLYIEDQFGSVAGLTNQIARLISNRDLIETRAKHADIPNSVNFITGVKGLTKFISAPVGAFCHYKFSKLQPHHADSFFIRLARATDMGDDHPIFVLRRRLENMSKVNPGERVEAIAITIKAWNICRKQKTVQVLRWSKAEDFPVAA